MMPVTNGGDRRSKGFQAYPDKSDTSRAARHGTSVGYLMHSGKRAKGQSYPDTFESCMVIRRIPTATAGRPKKDEEEKGVNHTFSDSARGTGSKNHAPWHSKYARGSNNAAYLKAQQNQVANRHLKQASQLSSESQKRMKREKLRNEALNTGQTAEKAGLSVAPTLRP